MKRTPWRFLASLFLGGWLCACASVPKSSATPREPTDVRLQRVVNHAWDKKPDQAHAELDGVLEEAPLYRSAWIVRACLFLEAGKLDAAARVVERLGELAPGDPEPRVLAALIDQRRLQPKGSWLDAMRQAWFDAGRPSLHHERRMELLHPMQDTVAIVWARTEDVEDRFIAALAGDPSAEQEQWLMDHVSGLRDPVLRLAAFEFFHRTSGPHAVVAARKRGRDLLRTEMTSLAAESTHSDLPLLLLVGGTSGDAPFTREELPELERLAELPRYRETRMAQLGDEAQWRLESQGVRYPDWSFYWAAMGTRLLGAPLELLRRLEVTKEGLTPEERLRLGVAVWKLGGRIAEGNTIFEGLMGYKLMEQGALLKGDEAGRALAATAAQRSLNADAASFNFRFELWPLPTFHREWLEASLDDEGRLLETFVAR
ncbi:MULTISPECIES: tetratricopeptide repeat protein [unclassified Corallococcus]|uniref:tetratricopeptide repeat protein n=1 Tax=unclassified Corallococcus TaxID=2685029 RepID=UPI001A8C50B5|nr:MULTISPECIES: hypothetical protein [unclassified Corallococcus]MBN9681801.1 hypothetical protein [Corallococcus sp. NCSPR001]WAS86629.1 hypothetical protein O0N60_06545 [Corallococcus sp. NCRR]